MADLSGGWNFRDVSTSTGGAVRPGCCSRSGELTKIDDTGLSQLQDIRLTDVADLRSPREIERHGGDRVPDGVGCTCCRFSTSSRRSRGSAARARLSTTADRKAGRRNDSRGRPALHDGGVPPVRPGSRARNGRAPHGDAVVRRRTPVLTHCSPARTGPAWRRRHPGGRRVGPRRRDGRLPAEQLRHPQLREQIMDMIARRFEDGIPSRQRNSPKHGCPTTSSASVPSISTPRSTPSAPSTVRWRATCAAGITDEEITSLRAALLG